MKHTIILFCFFFVFNFVEKYLKTYSFPALLLVFFFPPITYLHRGTCTPLCANWQLLPFKVHSKSRRLEFYSESICLIWFGPLGCSAGIIASIHIAISILMFLLRELEKTQMLSLFKNRVPSWSLEHPMHPSTFSPVYWTCMGFVSQTLLSRNLQLMLVISCSVFPSTVLRFSEICTYAHVLPLYTESAHTQSKLKCISKIFVFQLHLKAWCIPCHLFLSSAVFTHSILCIHLYRC